MNALISTRTESGYSEDGEYLDGDVRLIEEDRPETYAPDSDDVELYGSAVDAIVQYLRNYTLGVFEANVHPIPADLRDHCWLTATAKVGIKDLDFVTTVRIAGCTDAERADIFRRVTAT